MRNTCFIFIFLFQVQSYPMYDQIHLYELDEEGHLPRARSVCFLCGSLLPLQLLDLTIRLLELRL